VQKKKVQCSGAGTFFKRGGGRKYKMQVYFAPKLPSICINQKCSMTVGSCTFFSHLT